MWINIYFIIVLSEPIPNDITASKVDQTAVSIALIAANHLSASILLLGVGGMENGQGE